MTSPQIEPGLLRLFRWYVVLRLGILLLQLGVTQDPMSDGPVFAPQAGILILGLLLAYLLAGPQRTRLGRSYLPIAIWVATLGPIIENAVTVNARLAAGTGANEAVSDYWLYLFYLFVPVIIVAWQYRFRWVVLFSAGTLLLDGAFTAAPLEDTGADLALLSVLMFARTALFLFVGLIINRLVTALRRQRDAVAASVVSRERLAMSEERRRLARELHDTLAHTLSALAVQLEGAMSVWDNDQPRAREMVETSLATARQGLGDARRSITALRASPLEEGGLVAALEEACRSAADSLGFDVDFSAVGSGPSDPDIQHTAFRIAGEAMTNVVRHSRATRVSVEIRGDDTGWGLTVEDNGSGFDLGSVDGDAHMGITGMRERAELIGASFTIRTPAGGGTVVEVTGGER